MDNNPNLSSRQSSGKTEIPAPSSALDTARTAQRLFRTFGSKQEALTGCSSSLRAIATILEVVDCPNHHIESAIELIAEQLQEP